MGTFRVVFVNGEKSELIVNADRSRGIEVVDAQLVGSQSDLLGLLERDQRETSPGLADDGELFAGFAKDPGRNVARFELARPSRSPEDGDASQRATHKSSAIHESSREQGCMRTMIPHLATN